MMNGGISCGNDCNIVANGDTTILHFALYILHYATTPQSSASAELFFLLLFGFGFGIILVVVGTCRNLSG